jgi:hypothetical protein
VLCDVCVRLDRVAEQVCQVCGPQSSAPLARPLLAAQVPQVFGVVRSGSTPVAVRLVAATSLDAQGPPPPWARGLSAARVRGKRGAPSLLWNEPSGWQATLRMNALVVRGGGAS